jgi:hypothetical protein
MKSKSTIAILVFFTAFALAFAGCDDENTGGSNKEGDGSEDKVGDGSVVVPEKWRGTYKTSRTSADSFVIGDNSAIYTDSSGGSITINNMRVVSGGTVATKSTGTHVGEWVYLFSNNDRVGVLVQNNIETVVGIGAGGVTSIAFGMQIQFELSPPINSSTTYSTNLSYWATKQK